MLAPFVNLFIKLGISPDAVTVVGTLGVSAGALVFFPQGLLWQGCLVITAFVFSDLIDGAMARKIGRTDKFGAFLDSTLDRIADGALFGGMALFFAWQAEDRLYLVLSLVCLVMGSVTSYARVQGRAARLQREDRVRRAAGPARRRCWSRCSSATCWTCRSSTRSRCGCSPCASTITVVQRILLVRRQAVARAADAESASAPDQTVDSEHVRARVRSPHN